MSQYLNNIYFLFLELSPFLILGFFISGILSVLLTVDFVSKYLGRKQYSSVFLASILGVPLPLCSCGVIPVASYLRSHGANKGSVTSFLISTPQTGVDSIMMTYSLLGPLLAIYRPIVSFISGLFGGSLVHFLDTEKNVESNIKCEDVCCDESRSQSKIIKVLHYGFIRLPIDIVNPLVVGLLLSGLIGVFIPQNYFVNYGSGIVGMLIMLLISLPTYICATASVPIAFVLYTKGFSLGAILVFLMAGPATNITTIAVLLKILGKKSTLIYLLSIIFCALLGGAILDGLSLDVNFLSAGSHVHQSNNLLGNLSAIFLFGIIINSLRIKYFENVKKESKEGSLPSYILNVDGMTCSHCEETIIKTLTSLSNIEKVNANVKTGNVEVHGRDIDIVEVKKNIKKLGFKIVEN